MEQIKHKRSIKTDVLKLVTGTVIAQLINVLATPILARIFAPEFWGALTLFTSITSVITITACLRYEFSIMLPDNNEDAANLLFASIMFSFIISAISFVIFWTFGDSITTLLSVPELAKYYWLIPIMVLFSGIFNALNYWNSRNKKFTRLSINKITKSVVTSSSQIAFGYAGFLSGGTLISAAVAGQAITTTSLFAQIWNDDRKLFIGSIRVKRMVGLLKRHKKFPLFGLSAGLLNTLSWQAPIFFLAYYFSSTVVGYYGLGLRILQLPMSLLGTAIGQVFFQRAAELKNADGNLLSKFIISAFDKLVIFSIYPILVLSIIGKDLYFVVFGPTWAEAGMYTQFLSLWAFFWFISTPLSTLGSLMEQQKFTAYWNIVLLILRIGSVAIGGYYSNIYLSLGLFSLTGAMMYILLFVVQFGWVGIHWSETLSVILRHFIITIPLLLGLLLVKIVFTNEMLILSFAIISIIVYYYFQYKRNPRLVDFKHA